MAVTPLNYTRKDPDIQIVKFEGNVSEMEEIRDWVLDQLPEGSVATLNTTMGNLAFRHVDNEIGYNVSRGHCILKDSNGMLTKIEEPILRAFYDLVP